MVCLGQDDAFAKSRSGYDRYHAYRSRTVVPTRVNVQPAPAPKCGELPQACGLASFSRHSRCTEFWYTHLQADSEAACDDAAANNPNFSEFVVCGRMYRNAGQFPVGELNYAKQFGDRVIARGSCPSMQSLPMCNQVAPVAAGGYCRCPADSLVAVAACEPNESNTSCLSTSIANQCGE